MRNFTRRKNKKHKQHDAARRRDHECWTFCARDAAHRADPAQCGSLLRRGGALRFSSNSRRTSSTSWIKRRYKSLFFFSTQRLIASRLASDWKIWSTPTASATQLTPSNDTLIIFVYMTSRSLTEFLKMLKSSCQWLSFTSRIWYLRLRKRLIWLSNWFWIATSDLVTSWPRTPLKNETELSSVVYDFRRNWIWPSQTSRRSRHLWTKASVCAKIDIASNVQCNSGEPG